MKILSKLLMSVFISFTIILWSINITINFPQIYYLSAQKLHIYEDYPLSKEDLKLNYDYLINYLTSFHKENFNLPSFPSSPKGIQHFEEVKHIFVKIEMGFYACYFISCLHIFLLSKSQNYSMEYLKISCTILLFILAIMGLFFINFEKGFTIFHSIAFQNDYWLFDPNTDPVINILPQKFFLICFTFIFLLILLNCISLLILYKKLS